MLGQRRFLASVSDVTVKVTFIDHEGSRASVPGRVGMSISQVAHMHGIDIGPTAYAAAMQEFHSPEWTEDKFGFGPALGFDHVQIPEGWHKHLPKMSGKEQELLEMYWEEEVTASSRLGCMIPLKKELDGIQVYIPDGIPAERAY